MLVDVLLLRVCGVECDHAVALIDDAEYGNNCGMWTSVCCCCTQLLACLHCAQYSYNRDTHAQMMPHAEE